MIDIKDLMALQVQNHDQASYLVLSGRGKRQYLVDLLADNGRGGIGVCTCPDYELNRNAQCKHLLRCKIYLAEGILKHLAKEKR